MLADLPTACDLGCKKNSKGYKETWTGYKLHIDVACGQIPVSCLLTSASVHDSQVAIPLMTMTSARVSYLYDLMDAAYDAAAIHAHSRALGHAPIVDRNFRADHQGRAGWGREVERLKLIHMPDFDDLIYDFRTMAERVNARLKDEFGARFLRVRGALKVKCHLMFGIVALAVDQIIRVVDCRTAQAVLQAQWFIALPMLVDHFAHAVGFAPPQRPCSRDRIPFNPRQPAGWMVSSSRSISPTAER